MFKHCATSKETSPVQKEIEFHQYATIGRLAPFFTGAIDSNHPLMQPHILAQLEQSDPRKLFFVKELQGFLGKVPMFAGMLGLDAGEFNGQLYFYEGKFYIPVDGKNSVADILVHTVGLDDTVAVTKARLVSDLVAGICQDTFRPRCVNLKADQIFRELAKNFPSSIPNAVHAIDEDFFENAPWIFGTPISPESFFVVADRFAKTDPRFDRAAMLKTGLFFSEIMMVLHASAPVPSSILLAEYVEAAFTKLLNSRLEENQSSPIC
jgi:hypothetical protein